MPRPELNVKELQAQPWPEIPSTPRSEDPNRATQRLDYDLDFPALHQPATWAWIPLIAGITGAALSCAGAIQNNGQWVAGGLLLPLIGAELARQIRALQKKPRPLRATLITLAGVMSLHALITPLPEEWRAAYGSAAGAAAFAFGLSSARRAQRRETQ